MAQTLEHNKEVTTVVPITLPTFDDDLEIIQKLDDEPNDVGGLTAAELKAKFDEGNLTAQTYINNVLIPQVVADDATEQARQAAEAERVANEIDRVGNENTRLTAEQGRVDAEAQRVAAEQGRVDAEAQRVLAEQSRVDVDNGIVAQATAQASAATDSASEAGNHATNASASASAAAGSATTAGTHATNAGNSAAAAGNSAAAAGNSATAANNSKVTAESWAVGGTGTRAGEDTNNAKYWSEQAKSAVSADMEKAVYDPTEKKTDIFAYADTAESNAKAYAYTHIASTSNPHGVTAAQIGAKSADESDVFIATYGTTTSAEIEAAYQAGQWIFVNANGMIGSLMRRSSATSFTFVCGANRYDCVSDAWSSQQALAAANHAAKHATGGTDPITPESIGAAPAYTYGTADLTAGSSSLATGTLYFVYE